jgi:putative hydrolase of the HAD superfamily
MVMNITTFLIDLDETVYPSSSGLWEKIRERIDLYMEQEMGFNPHEIPDIRRAFYATYGTTLRGLQATYGIDAKHYLDFVHDIPLSQYISPDPSLRETLLSYPQKKIIFTNADKNHAQRVLTRLEILDCFDDIIDIFTIQPYCKPQPQAFEIALKQAGIVSTPECAFIDDNLPNLATARHMGLYSIRVGSREVTPECDGGIASLKELPVLIQPTG